MHKREKGVQKRGRRLGQFYTDWGIENDAHAGHWHRQVSLLSADKIEDFRAKGADVVYGDFGENLVVSGLRLPRPARGHAAALRRRPARDDADRQGVPQPLRHFQGRGRLHHAARGRLARVLEGGVIKNGDEMEIVARTTPRPYQAAVITLSDKGAAGEREDTSGPPR